MEADGREPVWPPHTNTSHGTSASRRLISLQSVRSPMQHDGVSSSQVDSSEVSVVIKIYLYLYKDIDTGAVLVF